MDKNAYMQFDCSLWIGRHLGMAVTNAETGTNVSEIAERIYRINTPVSMTEDQQFSFNQYLIDAERPLLFHTGHHRLFAAVREAVDRILPVQTLRYVDRKSTRLNSST